MGATRSLAGALLLIAPLNALADVIVLDQDPHDGTFAVVDDSGP